VFCIVLSQVPKGQSASNIYPVDRNMESFDLGPCTACVGKVSDQATGILFSTRLPSDFRVVRKNNTQVVSWLSVKWRSGVLR